MALCYDPTNRLATGFLGVTTDQMDELLEMLDNLRVHAMHPVLLPILMYSVCSSLLRRQIRAVDREINYVQNQTGLLKGYLSSGKLNYFSTDAQNAHEKPNYNELHEILIAQHARSTNGLSDFVADLWPCMS
jgi:hypothetical protein